MPVLPILTLPDPRLRRPSAPVGAITERVRRLAADMLETMYDAPGVGLAAVQVGEPLRLVVADVGPKDGPRAPLVLVDPEVVAASALARAYEEGCLSIPDHTGEVTRPARVTVRYRDLDGEVRQVEADGLLATCLQHEIDHLDGRLFIDHLSRLKRDLITRKFAKQARLAEA